MTLANDLEKNWRRGKARMNLNKEGDLLYNKNMMKTGSQWMNSATKLTHDVRAIQRRTLTLPWLWLQIQVVSQDEMVWVMTYSRIVEFHWKMSPTRYCGWLFLWISVFKYSNGIGKLLVKRIRIGLIYLNVLTNIDYIMYF